MLQPKVLNGKKLTWKNGCGLDIEKHLAGELVHRFHIEIYKDGKKVRQKYVYADPNGFSHNVHNGFYHTCEEFFRKINDECHDPDNAGLKLDAENVEVVIESWQDYIDRVEDDSEIEGDYDILAW